MDNTSSFPVLVQFIRTGETAVFFSPEDIPTGRAFKVLKTNYNTQKERNNSGSMTFCDEKENS